MPSIARPAGATCIHPVPHLFIQRWFGGVGYCGIFYSSTSQLFHDARLHVRLGQYKQAIQDYDEAITLNPLHVNSYVARGRAHQLLGNSTEAERDLQKATELGYTP